MADIDMETSKRLALASRYAAVFANTSLGVILAGSVAYAPRLNVTAKSDLDLLVVTENLKSTMPFVSYDDKQRRALANRFFEGYCIKREQEGVPVSIHLLSKDAFDIICKCFVADIRVYRENAKPGNYILNGFEGNTYDYWIKNIPLPDLQGVRTIVPISFIGNDRYYIGVYRDKLLSNPVVLHEHDGAMSSGIEKLWSVVVENLRDESVRLYGALDLQRLSIINALSKRDKMSADVLQSIRDKTAFYLAR